jgi:DNA polymerase-1
MGLFDIDPMMENCAKCGLDKTCKTPKMKPSGLGYKQALIIGEAPGKTEDDEGEQFVGESGQVLQEQIRNNGLSFNNDFWRINAVNCWPNISRSKSRTPISKEIKLCNPYLNSIIKQLEPKYILVVGGIALESVFLGDFEKTPITVLHGKIIPDQKYKCWILPVFHPSYIMRNEYDQNLKCVYERDMSRAIGWIKKKREFPTYNLKYDLITDFPTIIQKLKKIAQEKKTVYFDYETTGLKPFKNGHKIVCVSMSVNNETFAFPFQYRGIFSLDEQEQIRKLLARIFYVCPLEAHNFQFEDIWTRNIIGVQPQNWRFDTMIAAHILDNRQGIAGLKMQTYLNFGIRPYDRRVSSFLSAEGSNEFNKVEQIPLMELLEYCAKDSGYGAMLSAIQKKQLIQQDLMNPYKFFHEGNLVLADMQQHGVCMDEKHFEEQESILIERIKKIEDELMSSNESRKFHNITGHEINLNSNKDISVLLYEILKSDPKYTKNGNLSADKNTLVDVDNPFIKKLLERKKLEKVNGTYIAQFKREIYHDKIHPMFNLGNVVSFRSSSQRPNFQNIPIRDELIKPILRKGIKASEGNVLFLFDFSGAEVRTSACFNQDPVMINYINDPTTDMHRDTACSIWMLPVEEVTKDIRFYAKNMWVFAQFYGSYWADCGENLWKTCIESLDLKTKPGKPLIDHLREKGIKTKEEFLSHCEKVEDEFWSERFKVYSQWKKDINRKYQKYGFIETFFGFRFSGLMNRKQACNYPIQGHSFHILLWIAIKLRKFIKENKMNAKMVLEIHDEIIFDTPLDEVPTIAKEVKRIIHEDLKKFDWAVVPFEVEFSITPINGSWYEKTDWKEEDL